MKIVIIACLLIFFKYLPAPIAETTFLYEKCLQMPCFRMMKESATIFTKFHEQNIRDSVPVNAVPEDWQKFLKMTMCTRFDDLCLTQLSQLYAFFHNASITSQYFETLIEFKKILLQYAKTLHKTYYFCWRNWESKVENFLDYYDLLLAPNIKDMLEFRVRKIKAFMATIDSSYGPTAAASPAAEICTQIQQE